MSKAAWLQHASSFILGIFFINVGIGHFLDPEWFEPIVPTILGDATFWVLVTGVMEVALGFGLIIPQTRKYAGLFMAIFLIGVYWANLNMWINNLPLEGKTFENKWHVLRLMAQLLMISVALWVGNWFNRKNNINSENVD